MKRPLRNRFGIETVTNLQRLHATAIAQRTQVAVKVWRLCNVTAMAVVQRQRLCSGVRRMLAVPRSTPRDMRVSGAKLELKPLLACADAPFPASTLGLHPCPSFPHSVSMYAYP